MTDAMAMTGPLQLPRRRVLTIIGALMLGMFLAALDQTVVSTALPTIVGDLHGGSHLTWVVTAYLLASTVSTPLWGKLGDLYGRKVFFQAAIVIFLIGSALAGMQNETAMTRPRLKVRRRGMASLRGQNSVGFFKAA